MSSNYEKIKRLAVTSKNLNTSADVLLENLKSNDRHKLSLVSIEYGSYSISCQNLTRQEISDLQNVIEKISERAYEQAEAAKAHLDAVDKLLDFDL